MKLLSIHGVGQHAPGDASWQDAWRNAIRAGVQEHDAGAEIEFRFVQYDHLFADDPPETWDYLRAVAELLAGQFDWRSRAVVRGDLARSFSLRWTAGMVAQWITDDELRAATRDLLLEEIKDFRPEIVLAHSLGSLIAYDTYRLHAGERSLRQSTLVTFGSQISHPAVDNQFGGRIGPVSAKDWYNLHNEDDRVFTAPIRVSAPNFEQIEAHFDGDFPNHHVTGYLTHRNVRDGLWQRLVDREPIRAPRVTPAGVVAPAKRAPNRKAVLVGINDYARVEDRLEGCVNDAYRLSSVLQECGFAADGIRLLLNGRATGEAIRERFAWLLDDVREGDVRFLGYSGHGAQVPTYGPNHEPDGFDECLLPSDFDWSRPETLVMDTWIRELYAQIPYGVHFVIFLDCCHAGGMTRGGGPKARMLTPPDDVRHRALRWDRELQMWVRRDMPPIIPVSKEPGWNVADYIGTDMATRRFGRATMLRRHDDPTYDRLKQQYDHKGPYLPMILQACQEHQVAFEYHDGAAAYGAFTFCVTKLLRELAGKRKVPTFDELCRQSADLLRQIGYQQDPLVVGPKHLREADVPFGTNPPRRVSETRTKTVKRRGSPRKKGKKGK